MRYFRFAILTALLSLGLTAAHAKDRTEPPPKALENLGVTEHLKSELPLQLSFVNEDNQRVTLADYFHQGKPVILTMNYLNCPMLCTLVLNAMVDSLKQTGLTPDKDFDIVTVSFNPLEKPVLAKLKKQNYLKYWGEDGVSASWHFLTGDKDQIDALVQATGFSYQWDAKQQQFAHPAVIFVATPDGKLSRYLYGVQFDPQVLRLSLVDASKGKIGTPMDQILLFCYHYDAAEGRYAPVAMNIMRLGGGATLLVFGIVLALFWAAERRRAQSAGGGSAPPAAPPALGGSKA